MDESGPVKDTRDGESDVRGKVPVDGIMDDCFQSLMSKNPNQKITIHDPCIIPKEESPRVKDQIGNTDILHYPYTKMESKSFTELNRSNMDVQHTGLKSLLGTIEPQETVLDLSLKNKINKLQDPCCSTKLLPEESTVAVSSSVKGELTPSMLRTRVQCRPLPRSQPYRIPVRINKNHTLYGMFQPEFIIDYEDGNSSQEMSRRGEDDESGKILDALKVDHIDRPPPEVTFSAYSNASEQLTIPEMEPNSPEYIHQSRYHNEPLDKMGSAVAVEKATSDASYSRIPILDETQTNVNTWHTPKTQSWRPKLRDKLAQKSHTGGKKTSK
ncbi:hypothetical protein ACJMK2_042708 [Sinanodonta woodiana]|uniref:Uncharacterized protein n=1 Tax=Sinanodonta woodiana TaxID=1069815 RepID=A0ABD3W873_SINWO